MFITELLSIFSTKRGGINLNLSNNELNGFKSFQVGQALQGSIERGEDLLESLEEIIIKAEIEAGFVQVLGAVKKARMGYFNQSSMEYEIHEFNKPMEILHCMGNISLSQEEKPTLHAHIVLGDNGGNAFGGHLEKGTEVFVAETIIQEYHGKPQQRKKDPESGLTLWR